MNKDKQILTVGDYVTCEGKDSYFEGTVVSVFPKLNGSIRYVIEDERRLLLIKGPNSITSVITTRPIKRSNDLDEDDKLI